MSDLPPGEGWMMYMYISPNPLTHDNLELWRKGWESPRSVRYCNIDPMMNIHGLWWRLVPKEEEKANV